MIVRTLYIERTHDIAGPRKTFVTKRAGCTFATLYDAAVRTRCDQFIENEQRPIVVIFGETEPTCTECREKLRIEALRVAASAE